MVRTNSSEREKVLIMVVTFRGLDVPYRIRRGSEAAIRRGFRFGMRCVVAASKQLDRVILDDGVGQELFAHDGEAEPRVGRIGVTVRGGT